MKNRIFILTKFLKVSKKLNEFHFIGFYKGEKINKVYVNGGEFEKGSEYILALDYVRVESNSLYGDLKKVKKLDI